MKTKVHAGCTFVLSGLLLVLCIGVAVAWNTHSSEQTCTVTGKESVSKGEDGHEYRVYTSDCGTLTVSDSLWHGRFNAADTCGQLREGGSYDVTTIGWRFGLFSMMPNIIEATPQRDVGTAAP